MEPPGWTSQGLLTQASRRCERTWRHGNPPFDEYARIFGAAGLKVADPGELEDAFAEALRLGRTQPVLVDVLCTPDVFPEPRRKETVKAERLRQA